jgi:hypothetical protein
MLLRPDQCVEDSPHGSCARGPVISRSGEDVLPGAKRGDSSVDAPIIDLKGRTVERASYNSSRASRMEVSSRRVGRFSGHPSSIPESDSSLLKMLMLSLNSFFYSLRWCAGLTRAQNLQSGGS